MKRIIAPHTHPPIHQRTVCTRSSRDISDPRRLRFLAGLIEWLLCHNPSAVNLPFLGCPRTRAHFKSLFARIARAYKHTHTRTRFSPLYPMVHNPASVINHIILPQRRCVLRCATHTQILDPSPQLSIIASSQSHRHRRRRRRRILCLGATPVVICYRRHSSGPRIACRCVGCVLWAGVVCRVFVDGQKVNTFPEHFVVALSRSGVWLAATFRLYRVARIHTRTHKRADTHTLNNM